LYEISQLEEDIIFFINLIDKKGQELLLLSHELEEK